MINRAVFLDRDGVINKAEVRLGKPYPPASLRDFVYLPGVIDGVRRLRNAGYLVIVATNQPDVAKGIQDRRIVDAMHEKLAEDLLCDDIKVCFHVDADGCNCRKPKPGMILEAAAKWHIDLKSSFMVGDRWRDIEAGNLAGCTTFFIDYGYQEKKPDKPSYIVQSLEDAVDHILKNFNIEGYRLCKH